MADEPPRTVKDLLAEAKDTSEVMVDLAYAALFFNDEDLAEEVDRLEEVMDGYLQHLRRISMLAARSPEDAEAMGGVLHIAGAIEQIGDAAADIARIVTASLGIPEAIRPDLRHADEIAGRVKVREGADCVGRSLRELMLPTETGMWLIAVRRGDEWEYDPGPDTVVNEGDVLLYQGPEDGVNLIRAMAAEVTTLEGRSDQLQDELESWVLRAAPEARNSDELRGLIRLAYASERIFDAARSMTSLVEAGEELHPVVADAIHASEEVSVESVVEEGSPAVGRSLKELSFETETGMLVLAVQRGRRWIYRPRARFQLESGDRVISIGPEDGIAEIEALVRAPTTAPAAR